MLLTPDSLRLESLETNKFILKCKAVENANRYELYKKNGSGTFDVIDSAEIPEMVDTSVVPGDDGCYKVRAYSDSTGYSLFSDSLNISTDPLAPAGVIASNGVSSDTIVVSWKMDSLVQEVDSFVIYAKIISLLSEAIRIDSVHADFTKDRDTLFDSSLERTVGEKYLYFVKVLS